MQTGHELFVHGMSDILDGERQLVEALQELENDSTSSQLKKAFASHRKETEQQVERLSQCFELLGESPTSSECKGIKGLVEEKKAFMEEDPAEDILDVFHVGAAIKTETYEICEYKSLIQMAREMKHTKVAQLLAPQIKGDLAAWRTRRCRVLCGTAGHRHVRHRPMLRRLIAGRPRAGCTCAVRVPDDTQREEDRRGDEKRQQSASHGYFTSFGADTLVVVAGKSVPTARSRSAIACSNSLSARK